ncbi:MAG TPA: VOC family protein [Steroidobacteraceae bacterium]|nr:VOC family protein [Steroidobacteraceae bacterium]
MERRLYLDHLGLLARQLPAAVAALQRLGFAPAPPSFHRERSASADALQKTGTANQCLMFRRGYVEVLGIVDRARYSGWITGALQRYQGMHVVGFGCDEIDRLLADLAAEGHKPLVRKLTRAVDIGGEERPVSFTILFHSDAEFPEGRFVTMQHHSREVLWHASLLDHPNGAQALCGVTLIVDDVEEFAARVVDWTGASVERVAKGAVRMDLPGGFIDAMHATLARNVYGDALPASSAQIVGMTIGVASIDAAARLLDRQNVSFRTLDDGLLVPACECVGAFIHFVPEG